MSAPDLTPPRRLPVPLAFSSGLLMGAADSVPGVSGGTIALVLGIYERLIESIGEVLRLPVLVRRADGRARLRVALAFLAPLAAGVLVAYFVGTRLLVGPADAKGLLRRPDTAPLCYGFFFGLVLFSLGEPWRRMRARGPGRIALAAAAAAVTAWAVALDHVTEAPADWMLLYGGALAVSVMLLPGVSGSLLLVVLGQYTTVAGAMHDREWTRLLVFGVGIGLGLVLFVPFLRALLRRHHDATMAVLTGLMAGSLRALWPWKNHYDLKDLDRGRIVNTAVGGDWPWVLAAVAVGAASVLLLRRLEARIERAG